MPASCNEADNASPEHLDEVLLVLGELGTINVRRAYGNWAKASLKGWEKLTGLHSIIPMQQFDVAKGKSATDMRMTIDAMDLLYRGHVDGFGIMSSDSDFLPLIKKLQYLGKQVIVTGPPALTAQIDFVPVLPADRAQLVQRFPQGNAIKCMAVYDEPFWRADGLAGQVTGDADPVRITFDNSPPDGSPGVMLGFIEGHAARVWSRRPAAANHALDPVAGHGSRRFDRAHHEADLIAAQPVRVAGQAADAIPSGQELRHQSAAVQPYQQSPEHAQQMCVQEVGMRARAATHIERDTRQPALSHGD